MSKNLDPSKPGPIGPGEITDRAAYERAKAAGLITELEPSLAELQQREQQLAAREARQRQAEQELHQLAMQHTAREQHLVAIERELRQEAERQEAKERELEQREAQLVRSLDLAPGYAAREASAWAADEEPVSARKHSRAQAVFDEEVDRQQDQHESFLEASVGTLSLPPLWGRVLKALVPAAGVAARGVVRSFHPESPGGSKPTRGELEAVVDRASARFRRELFREFILEDRR